MKKQIFKKVLAGTLAAGMVLGLTACGGSDVKSITISLPTFYIDHVEQNDQYDRLVKEIADYTGMEVTWEWALGNDAYYGEEGLGLKLSTGNVADVLVVGTDAAFFEVAEDGLFWDLKPYLKDYDNLATIPEATLAAASYNGKLYGIPRSRTLARHAFGYRVDWLNNLGLSVPTTWDEFKNVLDKFTNNDPDKNGQNDTVGLYLDSWTGAWNIMWTWLGVPNVWGIDTNGDLVHYTQTPEYKNALAEFRDLYSRGLINQDFDLVAGGDATKKGLRASLGGVGVQTVDDLRKVEEAHFESEDVGMATPDNPIFMLSGYVDGGYGPKSWPTTGFSGLIAISTKNIKTEAQLRQVLEFLNALNDGEMIDLIDKGWENLTWNYDENGYYHGFNDEEMAAAGVPLSTYKDGFNQVIAYYTADANLSKIPTAPMTSKIRIKEEELKVENIPYCVPNYGSGYNSAFYTDNHEALDTIINDAQLKYIKGEIDQTALDAAIQQWWTAGGETVTKEMNEAYHAAGN